MRYVLDDIASVAKTEVPGHAVISPWIITKRPAQSPGYSTLSPRCATAARQQLHRIYLQRAIFATLTSVREENLIVTRTREKNLFLQLKKHYFTSGLA